jgi:uracil-DNA glycosylase
MGGANTSVEQIVGDIAKCRICVETPGRRGPLPHEPRPVIRGKASARLCIAGQAPGTRVHASGMPFTDPSGDRLRDWMGLTAETFYDDSKLAIVPMGFCFPGLDAKGGDLPPRPECAKAWHGRVFESLENLELILLIGGYSQKYHLGMKAKATLTETVRAWEDYMPRYLPLPHPSWRNTGWLKKNPWFEQNVLPVLKREVSRLVS